MHYHVEYLYDIALSFISRYAHVLMFMNILFHECADMLPYSVQCLVDLTNTVPIDN
jgi:hypothetical protein